MNNNEMDKEIEELKRSCELVILKYGLAAATISELNILHDNIIKMKEDYIKHNHSQNDTAECKIILQNAILFNEGIDKVTDVYNSLKKECINIRKNSDEIIFKYRMNKDVVNILTLAVGHALDVEININNDSTKMIMLVKKIESITTYF